MENKITIRDQIDPNSSHLGLNSIIDLKNPSRITVKELSRQTYTQGIFSQTLSYDTLRCVEIYYKTDSSSTLRNLGIVAIIIGSFIAGATVSPELWEGIKWLAKPAEQGELAKIFAQSFIGSVFLSLSLNKPKGVDKKFIASFASALGITFGAENLGIPAVASFVLYSSSLLPFLRLFSKLSRQ